MVPPKYTKFGKNLKNYDNNEIWNYVALDPESAQAIEIRFQSNFKTDIPGEIHALSANMFDGSSWSNTLTHEEITEQEFYAAYKLYLTRLVEHFKKHTHGQTQKTES